MEGPPPLILPPPFMGGVSSKKISPQWLPVFLFLWILPPLSGESCCSWLLPSNMSWMSNRLAYYNTNDNTDKNCEKIMRKIQKIFPNFLKMRIFSHDFCQWTWCININHSQSKTMFIFSADSLQQMKRWNKHDWFSAFFVWQHFVQIFER